MSSSSYRRIMTSCVAVVGSLVISSVYGYFEQKYFCEVEESSIRVSIQTGEKLCFDYLASMEAAIIELDGDISRAEGYVNEGSNDDRAYRRGIVIDLNAKKQERISLRERFIVAIDDYERDLFLRIKGLVGFYLKPERETISQKINLATTLLLRLKLVGDITKYEFVLEKLDGLQQKLSLLDRIKFSQNFSELIPALKEYLNGPRIPKDDMT